MARVSYHPLVLDKLARLRDEYTAPPVFRALVREIGALLAYEATASLAIETRSITTPLGPSQVERIADRVALVPILRAGLGMADGALSVLPDAAVWHIGIYRDEETLKPIPYYDKLPDTWNIDVAYILDPMLATGGSAAATVDAIRRTGVPKIHFIGIIGAPEGIAALEAHAPDVQITLAYVDERLNENGYIVPGLGDAGDRQFSTY